MLKVAICDDDLSSLQRYSERLESIANEIGVAINISKYANGKELLFDWEDEERRAEVLYLDVRMKGIDGIETAKQLRRMGCMCEIVFLTNSTEHMLDAFDVEAFHYIVKKQTDDSKFDEIFKRLCEKLEHRKKEYITFSCAGENRNILIDSIRYFQVEVRVITVYYGNNEFFEFYSTIGKVENALCAKGFIRIYRSVLINTAYVKSATPTEVIMLDGTVLPVGRSYWRDLKEELAR